MRFDDESAPGAVTEFQRYPAGSGKLFWGLITQVDPEVRREVLGSLFYTGPARRPYLFRFAMLMTLSVLIATFGILADSTAVVIGAMLVAPLMTPVLGLAAAAVMGWPQRLIITAIQVLLATAGAILVAFIVTVVLPHDRVDLVLPGELLARTDPTPLDLGIAIAAGAAGAYVLVRKEALSAAPGVAVAVALVPPLSAVGVSLGLGDSGRAGSALLLYFTNLAGIIVAAMVTLMLTGFVSPTRLRQAFAQVRLGFVIALVAVVITWVPLAINSRSIIENARDRTSIAASVEDWLGDDTELEVLRLTESSDEVRISLAGPTAPPPVDDLAGRLDSGKDVVVEWAETTVYSAGSGDR